MRCAALSLVMSLVAVAAQAQSAPATQSPDARAKALGHAMTLDEKIGLLHGHTPLLMRDHPADMIWTSGYVAGVPRLGVPPLREPMRGWASQIRWASAMPVPPVLPSGLAQAATFDPALAREGGAVLGAGPRQGLQCRAGGRHRSRTRAAQRSQFRICGEDPLLAGTMVGNEVAGIQSAQVISTLKHYRAQRPGDGPLRRRFRNRRIGQNANPISLPSSLRSRRAIRARSCVPTIASTTIYACENDALLNQVLKGDWHFPGFVMSDWGGTHSTEVAAVAGLDQEDGEEFDGHGWFAQPLKDAVTAGRVPRLRLRDMVHRILRTMIAKGVIDHPASLADIDYDADAAVSQRAAEAGIVLLRNEGAVLPLAHTLAHVAIIGGHADIGTLGGGGGSSEVVPHGGYALKILHPEADFEVYESYIGPAPQKTIAARLPGADIRYDDGSNIENAVALAKTADVAIVFVTQWTAESVDAPDLSLPKNQDALIAAVAAANPHTIVVLQTGGPVLMPWRDQVAGIVEAWYSGSRGGEAMARVLFGEVDASGRLPATFPVSEAQLPRPVLPGYANMLAERTRTGNPHAPPVPFAVNYYEGANVGYRWFETASSHRSIPSASACPMRNSPIPNSP